jgi:hypothetical protein
MSKIRINRFYAALLLWIAAAAPAVACTDTKIKGLCEVTTDCYTEDNFAGWGTSCIDGLCQCRDVSEAPCCPDGAKVCERSEAECRPKVECTGSVVTSGGGPSPGLACTLDEECSGPVDPRCGAGRCNGGTCEVELWAGEVIENQFPGDCKVNVCSFQGDVRVMPDPNDLPLDGNPCTWDTCQGEKPLNVAHPDGLPCPGKDSGICVLEQCRDCSNALKLTECSNGFLCYDDQCVPMTCSDFLQNGSETDTDCGGPDCAPCGVGSSCMFDSDCLSNSCGMGSLCQESTHTDGKKNDTETGADCGYPEGPQHMCEDGEGCLSLADCKSSVCYLGVCQVPTCTDDTENGDEKGIDCGSPDPLCPPCEN